MSREKTKAEIKEELKKAKEELAELRKKTEEQETQLNEERSANNMLIQRVNDQERVHEKEVADYNRLVDLHKKEVEELKKQIAEKDGIIEWKNKTSAEAAEKIHHLRAANDGEKLRIGTLNEKLAKAEERYTEMTRQYCDKAAEYKDVMEKGIWNFLKKKREFKRRYEPYKGY